VNKQALRHLNHVDARRTTSTEQEMIAVMAETRIETIERLEELAAWHRAIAERAGAAWVWEARLRTAENLERQVADIRARLQSPGTKLSARSVFPTGIQHATGNHLSPL
jgi:hypothetical protein